MEASYVNLTLTLWSGFARLVVWQDVITSCQRPASVELSTGQPPPPALSVPLSNYIVLGQPRLIPGPPLCGSSCPQQARDVTCLFGAGAKGVCYWLLLCVDLKILLYEMRMRELCMSKARGRQIKRQRGGLFAKAVNYEI